MPRPVEIKVTSDTSTARKELGAISGDLAGMDKSSSGLTGTFKKLGAALLAGGALAKAGGYLKEAAFAASDMNETLSKTKAIFGRDAAGVVKWAKDSDAALVSTERKVLDVAGGFALLLGNKGINGPQGRRWSQNLTNLAADLASFFNTDFDQAAAAISSALKGEMDPIEAYGVSINDAALKVKAFEMGLYSGKGALDANTKASAAYALIMEQTAKAQGDVNKTQGGMANQWRIMQTNLGEIKTTLGKSLTPLAEAILPHINDLLEDVNDYLGSKGFSGLVKDIGRLFKDDIVPRVQKFKDDIGKVNTKDIKADFGWIRGAVDKIAVGAKAIWDAFMNLSPETKSNIAVLVAAGAALKSLTALNPIIKIGVELVSQVITTAASQFTAALVGNVVPMKVFVVNQVSAMSEIEAPRNAGRMGKLVKALPVIGDLIATGVVLYGLLKAEQTNTAALRKDLGDLQTSYSSLRTDVNKNARDISGAEDEAAAAGSGYSNVRKRLTAAEKKINTKAGQDLLDLEIAYRQRGDQATYRALQDMYNALRGRRTTVRMPGTNKPLPISAQPGEGIPLVTDEMIARAVYSTLLRSGVRNGTLTAVI